MDAWLAASPYRAVGIYISGASRGCRDQPNLTPTWISTQLTKGWRLLPITLGPQATCHPGFPRYGNDPVISGKLNQQGQYAKAFQQGTTEASTAVAAAQALGIVPGSTLWYDLEGYDVTNTACRESSLCVPQRVDPAAARARLRLRRLLQRRLGHQVARRRPGAAARGVHAARPDLDRAVGRPGQHLDDVHPLRRLDARSPDEAVPGRPQREVGRGDDQHRPQLPRPRTPTTAPRRRRATATAPRSTWPTTRGSSPRPGATRRTRARSPRSSAS